MFLDKCKLYYVRLWNSWW